MKEDKVFFPSGGIQLEGLLNIQEALSIRGGLVLCHPHPQYGGEMHNNVINRALGVAREEGFATLRFNFRGVGESGGSYSEGVGEKEDVRSAIGYLDSKLNHSGVPILILGYSFGAWVGLPIAVAEERVKGVVAVSPPLEMFDFDYFKSCKKKKLIIVGDKDAFCPSSLLEEWYEQLQEPKSLAIIQGADHFYSYQTKHIIQPIREFLKQF
ncbi:MAG: alpha/beta fold hydrolase [Deltaproteobacteria bacterium]|nr:alpha/beta fold hydrolase [Deltaproteobacteria bacterium]